MKKIHEKELTNTEQELHQMLMEEHEKLEIIYQQMVIANASEDELPRLPSDAPIDVSSMQPNAEALRSALYQAVAGYWHWAARTCGIIISILLYGGGDRDGEGQLDLRAKLVPVLDRLHNENADKYAYSCAFRDVAKELWDPTSPPFAPSRAMVVELIQLADLLYPDIFGDAGDGFCGAGVIDLPF